MAKRKRQVDGVFCLWQFVRNERTGDGSWDLMVSGAVDEDDRPMGNDFKKNDEPWEEWMWKETEYGDKEQILGRAVTWWSFLNGVMLNAIHPPEPECDDWYATQGVIHHVVHNQHWFTFIRGGFNMHWRTRDEAMKFVRGEQ